ncbi:MAG: CBS domain-containing protein [Candidatus Altiarchaeota archaeon]
MIEARKIMHQHTFVEADMPVTDVAGLMSRKRIGSVLIRSKKGLGILTERDITSKVVAKGKDPKKVQAGKIMTSPVTTIEGSTDLYEICRVFNENSFRRLPVVEKGEVIGILTTRDVVKQFIPRLFKETYHFKDFRF